MAEKVILLRWSEKEKGKAQLCNELYVSGLNGTKGNSIVKSTEKELLGRMLGNVDVLVSRGQASGCSAA